MVSTWIQVALSGPTKPHSFFLQDGQFHGLISEGTLLLLEFVFESLVGFGGNIGLVLGPPRLDAETQQGALLDLLANPGQIGGEKAFPTEDFAKVDCVFSMERTLRQDVYRAGDGVHAVWLERQQAFAPFWKKPFCGLGAHHRSILALERQTLNPQHTKLVIANPDMVRKEVEERFSFPADRIRVIPNGVDLERFRNIPRAEARSRFGLQPWDFVLLFVGSGWERKGLAYSVQLLRDLQKLEPDLPGSFRAVKLLVAGKGRPPLIRQRGVIYAGPVAEIETAYAAADLLAFLPVYEPAANVVSEALAAGLPVLKTVFNGASERIVQGENGQVFASPRERGAIFGAAMEWMERNIRISVGQQDLSMERNVEDTLEVISLAAEAAP